MDGYKALPSCATAFPHRGDAAWPKQRPDDADWLTARLTTAVLLAICLALVVGNLTGAAQSEVNHAGLVVRDQSGELTYAYVAFPETEISSLELLERSGIPTVTVGFGGLGEAVCAIAGEGCSVAECQRRLCQGPGPDDPFWQSFRQQTPGDWRWQLLGASSSRVGDGDIDGWSWTSGEPNLPAVTVEEIAELAAAQSVPSPGLGSGTLDWRQYAGAGAVLVAIGGGALFLVRRHADRRRAGDAA